MYKPALILALHLIAMHHGGAQTTPTYATLYSFTGQNGDGVLPVGALAIGRNGRLFGTTEFGGLGGCTVSNQTGCGTVFELSPSDSFGSSWKETVLYSFGSRNGDGAYPFGGLVIDAEGALYGTTAEGGTHNNGTVFVLRPPAAPGAQWSESVLHSFAGGERDGSHPYGGLVSGENGTLYGTTLYGGTQHLGTVFALQPPVAAQGSWTEKVLHSFTGNGGDGVSPNAGVVVGKNGTLYGTALGYAGMAFALCPEGSGAPWIETVLYTFGTQVGDGGTPLGGAVIGRNGKLYGANNDGGSPSYVCIPPVVGCGTVFELTPPVAGGGNWTEKVIYDFNGPNGSGANPVAGVVIGQGGTLFGTTTDGPGAVFQLVPPAEPGGSWIESVLHTFTGQNGDGADPISNLAIGPNGALYGTTAGGGSVGMGAVFALKP